MTSGAEGGSGFTADVAGAVLERACRTAGLGAANAQLLRLGSNAVYRLTDSAAIVRIARDPEASEESRRAVQVARWLEAEGFPATRVVAGVEQPLVVDGRAVTFWMSAQDRDEYAGPAELADLLRQLHWLEEPASLGLPYYDPFDGVWESLRDLRGDVADDDLAFLEERTGRIQKEYDRLDWVLDFGLIHGDANVGNALRSRDGKALLIDLDDVSLGQREWDLVLTALFYERLGWHTRAEYESFVYRYGFDLLNWPGYPVLADLRELKMTLWLGHQVASDEKAAVEFARRVRAIRTGGSRKDWQPF
ncbi:aminoglycoside phosphotransferase family protein [Streptomyces sp. NPDC047315]|uniref:aminoglycoside phosphotransferase family protein n=1 Tax=Streptomyces sp. NPDC047315 TaxID=3155142 RepID=UPI00340CAAE7